MEEKKLEFDDLEFEEINFGDFGLIDEEGAKAEDEAKEELSEVLAKFKDSAKVEKDVYWDNVDSEYWVAICFQSREQKEAFLLRAGLLDMGDKYLDGLEVAERMEIDIAGMTPPLRKVQITKNLKELAG